MDRPSPTPLPDAIASLPVEGRNLVPGSLADQLGPTPTLLAFVRHFGCTFCRELIAELRGARSAPIGFPRVILVTLSDVEETNLFLDTRWPQVSAIADPAKVLRTAFGIRRGGAKEFLAPGVWLAGMRAMVNGHGVGKPAGDVLAMPGMVLITEDEVLWEQVFQHAGSKPDFRGVLEAMAAWRARPQPPETRTSAPASGGVSSSSASR